MSFISGTDLVSSEWLEEEKLFNNRIVERQGNDLSEFLSLQGFKKVEPLS